MTATIVPEWEQIGKKHRDAVQGLLPAEWRLAQVPPLEEIRDVTLVPQQALSAQELEITESLSAEELLQKIANGKLSAVDVTKAFCHRATIAHQLTNCLSEILFTDAITEAEALDIFYQREGRVIGPLHGLPISLKDQFRVKGTSATLGYISGLKNKDTEETESWIVKQLRGLGAIIYAKTNAPTSLMAIETNNNIIGYTTNPYNRSLSSGGSSGGEASLIAMGGSPLGIGSDVGASIRLPCGYTNIVGLKPSHGRLPYLGVANSMEGHQTIESVIGPMGRYISDLKLLMKTALATKPWLADPKVFNLPWREEEVEEATRKITERKLTFGVLRTDELVTPHPPVRRVLDEAVKLLKAHGYEVIEWKPPAHAEGFGVVWDAFIADAGRDIHDALSASGETPIPELSAVYGEAYGHLPPKTVNDLWAVQRRKYEFQSKYLAYWESTAAQTSTGAPVDALICPVAPTVGFERGKGLYPGYTAVFNALDYSVAVIRGGRADKAKDPKDSHFKPVGDMDETIQAHYDPEVFDGAPIGLQIVCRRLEEEKVLAIAEEVEKIVFAGAR
ncbi:acetamidase [Trichoderma ceciliae]